MILLPFAFAVSVLTGHNDIARTAANTSETVLRQANVNSATFGPLGQFAADGEVWSQPLIAAGVGGVDLLIFCTRHNSCYAYDANYPGTSPIWRVNFGPTLTTSNPDIGAGELGCLSTPVVDQSASKVYVVCAGPGSGLSATYVLRQLSLTSGAVLQSVTITGQVPGIGDVGAIPADTTSGSDLVFYPAFEMQRPALLDVGGNIYIGFGSFDDTQPWHGWAFSYDKATLTRQAVYCSTPNSFGGAFWHAGGGLSSDGTNIYGISSNGASATGAGDMSQRYLKFTSTLTVSSSFLDPNATVNDATDKDFGAGRPLLIPGTSPQLLVSAGKDSTLYLVDTATMLAPQGFILVNGGSAHFGGQTYINGADYMTLSGSPIYRFAFNGTTFNPSPTLSSSSFSFPGAQLSGSSNGASDTIVWATTRGALAAGKRPVTLRAFHGTTLAEIYTSAAFGNTTKFSPPTVANGKVYVSTLDVGVQAFGLLPVVSVGGNSLLGGSSTVK